MPATGEIKYVSDLRKFGGTYTFTCNTELPLKKIVLSATPNGEAVKVVCVLNSSLVIQLKLNEIKDVVLEPILLAPKPLSSSVNDPTDPMRITSVERDYQHSSNSLLYKLLYYLRTPVKQDPELYPLLRTINYLMWELDIKPYMEFIEIYKNYATVDQGIHDALLGGSLSDSVDLLKHHCDHLSDRHSKDHLSKLLEFAKSINVSQNDYKYYDPVQACMWQIKCKITPVGEMSLNQLLDLLYYESNLRPADRNKTKIASINELIKYRQPQIQAVPQTVGAPPPFVDDVVAPPPFDFDAPSVYNQQEEKASPIRVLKHQPNASPGAVKESKDQAPVPSLGRSMHGFMSPPLSQKPPPEFLDQYRLLAKDPDNKKFIIHPNIEDFTLDQIISQAKHQAPDNLINYACIMLYWVNPMGRLLRNTAPPIVQTAYDYVKEQEKSVRLVLE